METLNEIDKMAASLLQKMPEIMEGGLEYGGELMERFITLRVIMESVPIALFILFLYPVYKGNKWMITSLVNKEWEYQSDGDQFFLSLLWNIPYLLVTISMIKSFSDLITLLVVPEMYIINYFN